jgi:hypothetical protein
VSEAKKTVKGVVFTLAGAPATPHIVLGVPGLYRPDVPTPVDDERLELVKAAIANGAPLDVVDIPKTKLETAQAQALEDLAAARTGAVTARQDGLVGAEAGVLTDLNDSTKD